MNENVKGMDWMQPRVEYPPPKIIYDQSNQVKMKM